jgi:haloalkane dehalogenase
MENDSPDWTFDGTWPHAPSWFETPEGRMHFVDVGPRTGRPVVLVHGNPSWGYLYRHFIPPLVASGHRVIVPDHLGFGRSDKPDRVDVYTFEKHARRFGALLDSLDLRDVTLVVHDWGGPIGLEWASRRSDRVKSLVILNAFVHRPTGPVAMPLPLRLFRLRGVGELMVKWLHAIVRVFLFQVGRTHHERLTTTERAAYLAPHPRFSSRTAILAFAREFPGGPNGNVAEQFGRIHSGLATYASRPVLIIWADKDDLFASATLALWQKDFPRAEVVHLPDAGHFLQDDAPEQAVPTLTSFLANHP